MQFATNVQWLACRFPHRRKLARYLEQQGAISKALAAAAASGSASQGKRRDDRDGRRRIPTCISRRPSRLMRNRYLLGKAVKPKTFGTRGGRSSRRWLQAASGLPSLLLRSRQRYRFAPRDPASTLITLYLALVLPLPLLASSAMLQAWAARRSPPRFAFLFWRC